MLSNSDIFLQLVRLGIGHRADVLPQDVNWQEIKILAEKQGLSAVVIDGIEKLPKASRPPRALLLEWIGETLQGYEYQYELYRKAIAELTGFYNSHGFKMMVLKGYACSLAWPKPEHRPTGDIDIWLFGKQKEADAVIRKEKGIKIDNSHHHHSVFMWRDIMVENHYDFINVHTSRSSVEMERLFKTLGEDDSNDVEINGERIYLPSPNLHALFLLKHMALHFVGANINLRQVLDWAFYVKKHTDEIDWDWLSRVLERFKMTDFYNCIYAICVGDLGFNPSIFPSVQFNPFLKERVLSDIIEPQFEADTPKAFIPRIVYKLKRWKGNSWKQEICCDDNRVSAFILGLWAKVLKPASF